MTKPFVIGFYGESNSGKTTIITKIIKKLTEDNFSVASIKNTNKEISIDQEDKDTWKHAEAGSQLVIFKTACETDYLFKKRQTTKEIIDNISKYDNYDIVIVEGANDKETQKIRIGNIRKRENTIYTYKNNFEKLYNLIKERIENG